LFLELALPVVQKQQTKVTLEPQKSSVVFQTVEPHWGETFVMRCVGQCKQAFRFTLICLEQDGEDFIR
jgi:hypothetical protein